MITGTVVKGKGLGKNLDFPTANINVEEDYKLIPKQGSYIIKSSIDDVEVFGKYFRVHSCKFNLG